MFINHTIVVVVNGRSLVLSACSQDNCKLRKKDQLFLLTASEDVLLLATCFVV